MQAPDDQHLHWHAEALWQQLEPLLPGLSVEVVARSESTNTQLIERARHSGGWRDAPVSRPGELDSRPHSLDDGLADARSHGRRAGDIQPCLLVAEHQTRGRGRQGRSWQSTASASLTFSLSLPLQPRDWNGLSLAAGVALAEALDPLHAGQAPRIGLKWPNDLMLRDADGSLRKLGGILVETLPVGRHRIAIIGIGLNVTPQPAQDLTWGYAHLNELATGMLAPRVLTQVALPLVRALLAFQTSGFGAIRAVYESRDLLKGRLVSTSLAEAAQGVVDGVDEDGALVLRVDGRRVRVASGEVSLRPVGQA